jgi:hypothetical protein
MKNLFKIAVFSVLLLIPAVLNTQVLITILPGDALNTEKIEFGLVGGMNRSYINTISDIFLYEDPNRSREKRRIKPDTYFTGINNLKIIEI